MNKAEIDPQAFIAEAEVMLRGEYGVAFEDACDEGMACRLHADGQLPAELVEHVAEKYALARIDAVGGAME